MTTNTIRSLAAALLLAHVCATSPATGQSFDDVTLLGQWEGEVISDFDLPFGSIALDITSQKNRSFQGLLGLVPPNPVVPPNPIIPTDPCRMLLSASGQVSLSSHTEEWTLNAHGVLEQNALALEYHINYRDGTQDFGLMLLSR